jgi:hypothetical protein
MQPTSDERGSLWRRWDPHMHAPGTTLNDQFGGITIQAFLSTLDNASPAVAVVGITDYLSTSCYESVVAAAGAMTLKNVQLIFPNVEMRLTIGTKAGAGVNLHLLVSPDDPKHVSEVRRFLSHLSFEYDRDRYVCTRDDLIRLGRHHDPAASDDDAAYEIGVNQFKVDFNQLRDEYKASAWVQENCLVAVAAGSVDGTSGLRTEDASFAAQRKEVEAFAQVIFSGNPKDATFWLGGGTLSEAEITKQYRALKPCLHGSDAHKLVDVAQPDKDRRCWIKGDATFDTLRQACIEPAARVFVGPDAPDSTSPNRVIARVSTGRAPWLLDKGVPLNPGLVAVIGERGSGKTALADLLAHGADSQVPFGGRDSFVSRAKAHLSDATVSLTWNSGETTTRRLAEAPEDPVDADVHYLSQQFVERLCSPEGAQDELIGEIKKVVFAAHEPADRLGTTSFDELLEQLTGDMHQRRRYLRGRLDNISSEVLTERGRKGVLPAKKAQRKQLAVLLAADVATRDKIVNSGQQARTEYYGRLRAAIDERNMAIQTGERRKQGLDHLGAEVTRFESRVFPDILSDLRQRYASAGLVEGDWQHFQVGFKGDVAAALATKKTLLDDELRKVREGSSKETPTSTSTEVQLRTMALQSLSEAFAKVTEEIGVDKDNQRKLKQLDERI